MEIIRIASRLPELTKSLKETLLQQSFEAGKLLIELEQEKDYGEWGTFENYVESELRINPRKAYRLMFAYRMRAIAEDLKHYLRAFSCFRVRIPYSHGLKRSFGVSALRGLTTAAELEVGHSAAAYTEGTTINDALRTVQPSQWNDRVF